MKNIQDMNTLNERVVKFITDRNIDKSDPRDQFLKVSEEVGELSASLARDDAESAKDAIGDAHITLVSQAMTLGLTIEECIQCAVSEVENRTGKIVNGIFIKDEDLKEVSTTITTTGGYENGKN